jgi:virulence factor Mce-like protein
MRRAVVIGLVTVLAAVGAVFAVGAGDPAGTRYTIVLDSAFGLVEGADFKVGGVPVGAISTLDVRRSDARALVGVEVSEGGDGFSGLRDDASCVVAPQSLIGEYFIDCQPGQEGELLDSGATIPVEQTKSPIPPDLVLNVMRQPVRERFRIVFGELGIGFAARGDDVNETIRRAIPAIGATSDVLQLLAERRQTLASLARDSGQVLQVLGKRSEDITDFVEAADKAASATAERRTDVAETFRRFPGFLDELEPTMTQLAFTSRRLAPTLADLRISAPAVTRLLETLQPFARASEPAVTSLGEASGAGRIASREAASLVARLGELGDATPEPAGNLRIILDHLDNRRFAVEDDPDSPGGEGYTGLEAPLQYIYDQSLALNIFDQRGYSLKISLTEGECSAYTDAQEARADPEKYARCNQNLGPNQPGITTPDPSGAAATRETTFADGDEDGRAESAPGAQAPAPTVTAAPEQPGAAPPLDVPQAIEPVQDLLEQLPGLVGPMTDQLRDRAAKALARGRGPGAPAPSGDLLDFLLAP